MRRVVGERGGGGDIRNREGREKAEGEAWRDREWRGNKTGKERTVRRRKKNEGRDERKEPAVISSTRHNLTPTTAS